MTNFGFVRVACAVPELRLADPVANVDRILELLRQAEAERVDVVVFPELCLTGYSCGDLFQQPTLQNAAKAGLISLKEKSVSVFSGLLVVGVPLAVNDRLYNTAAVLYQGQILGIVPKSYLPNSCEFYEARWFTPGLRAWDSSIQLDDQNIYFCQDLLFDGRERIPGLVVGVEICEDLWVPIPPSSVQALSGATVLLNLSASNEVIGKSAYRRQLVASQSGRCVAGYAYVSAGVHESTTDLIFGGHCLVAENGAILAESSTFQHSPCLTITDIDLERLQTERRRTTSFGQGQEQYCQANWKRVTFGTRTELDSGRPQRRLTRAVDAHPFVPSGQESLRQHCQDIFQAQVGGLARRLEHVGKVPLVLGVSGGLDSTLALLVACKTLDTLAWPRASLKTFTMPGFGTSARTLGNAQALMKQLGVNNAQVDIRQLCLDEMRALNHRPFGIPLEALDVDGLARRLREIPVELCHDLVFENIQARMRTSLLMNAGFVIGTSDLSELALGWCTYNGDHMSMYNPNVSIPKTLVKFLVRWAAENEFTGEVRRVLFDVVDTAISPELLPAIPGKREGDQAVIQATEEVVGPYELHDFFLFHFLRYGAPPEKILYLADHARFDRPYTADEIRRWLAVFIERFFASQYKRSCLPDGPKVGTVSLSPRGDWRMPSDVGAAAWKLPEN